MLAKTVICLVLNLKRNGFQSIPLNNCQIIMIVRFHTYKVLSFCSTVYITADLNLKLLISMCQIDRIFKKLCGTFSALAVQKE